MPIIMIYLKSVNEKDNFFMYCPVEDIEVAVARGPIYRE